MTELPGHTTGMCQQTLRESKKSAEIFAHITYFQLSGRKGYLNILCLVFKLGLGLFLIASSAVGTQHSNKRWLRYFNALL